MLPRPLSAPRHLGVRYCSDVHTFGTSTPGADEGNSRPNFGPSWVRIETGRNGPFRKMASLKPPNVIRRQEFREFVGRPLEVRRDVRQGRAENVLEILNSKSGFCLTFSVWLVATSKNKRSVKTYTGSPRMALRKGEDVSARPARPDYPNVALGRLQKVFESGFG